jgi:hypothetical protein
VAGPGNFNRRALAHAWPTMGYESVKIRENPRFNDFHLREPYPGAWHFAAATSISLCVCTPSSDFG